MIDFSQLADDYVESVLSGNRLSCQWEQLACKRSREDSARECTTDWLYKFDADKANRACEFISNLKFVSDSISTQAGQPFILRPDQVWFIRQLFGWVRKDNERRRFRRAFKLIPRGNGKSHEAAAIALSVVATDRPGAQVLCAASMKPQARIVLDAARDMALADRELRELFNLEVSANEVRQSTTGNVMKALSATASSVEGTAVSFAVLDELWASRGRKLHDSLDTGTAKKPESCFLCISTAGDDMSGICWEVTEYTQRILVGAVTDESFLGVIFAADDGDDWASPDTWRKCNPGLGISVDERSLEAECNRAKAVPGMRPAFKSRHLNCWLSIDSDRPFLEEHKIDKCFDPMLNEDNFIADPCEVGLDLASRIDLSSMTRAHIRNDDDGKLCVYAFQKSWLPSSVMKENHVAAFDKWIENGELVLTDGNTTDYAKVEETFIDCFFKYAMRSVTFDPMQSAYLCVRLQQQTGKPDLFIEMNQHAKAMTPGMGLLQELVADGRLKTNSSLLIWALKNLRARRIGSSLVQPVRPSHRALKIDPAVALVMALSRIDLSPSDGFLVLPRSMTF